MKIPKYAMIIRGNEWLEYKKTWCKIQEIEIQNNQMSLVHPEYGEFAWVSISNCKFSNILPKGSKKGFKDGFYLFDLKNNKYIPNLYCKENSDSIYKYLENKLGKWSLKNSDKYENYECHEYKNWSIIDTYSW
jgi:hypothetical protein